MKNVFFGTDGICFEIIDVLYIDRQKNKKFYTAPRSFYSLSIRLDGKGTFYFENNKISATKNTILLCPREVGYSQTSDGEKLIAIHLNIKTPNEFAVEAVPAPPKAQENFLSIYEIWKEKNKGYKYRANAVLSCFLAEFTNDSRWAIDYIEKNLSDANLSVKSLAQNEHVSEQYFRKKFKSKYSISPAEYIIKTRIERAKTLLYTGYYKVNEVANMVGIEDALYFSTLFKKHVGIPPSKYHSLN